MAIEDKKRYMRELREFDPEAAKKLEKKELRKAVSPFHHYYREVRPTLRNPDGSKIQRSDITTIISLRWKALGDEDKERYELMAIEDKKSTCGSEGG